MINPLHSVVPAVRQLQPVQQVGTVQAPNGGRRRTKLGGHTGKAHCLQHTNMHITHGILSLQVAC